MVVSLLREPPKFSGFTSEKCNPRVAIQWPLQHAAKLAEPCCNLMARHTHLGDPHGAKPVPAAQKGWFGRPPGDVGGRCPQAPGPQHDDCYRVCPPPVVPAGVWIGEGLGCPPWTASTSIPGRDAVPLHTA